MRNVFFPFFIYSGAPEVLKTLKARISELNIEFFENILMNFFSFSKIFHKTAVYKFQLPICYSFVDNEHQSFVINCAFTGK